MSHAPDPRSARVRLAATAAIALIPAPARAGGFALFEQGARSMGFAGAFTAQASDPSAIFHNAAGIAFLKGQQLSASGRDPVAADDLRRQRSRFRARESPSAPNTTTSSLPPSSTAISSPSAWSSERG